MSPKNTYKSLLAGISIILALLPVIVTFSALLTTVINKIEWYVILQRHIVPFEARIVAGILHVCGIESFIDPASHFALFLEKNEVLLPINIEWNCLGWQSMLLFGITIVTGLRGDWRISSKLQVILFGLIGTFLINIIRMVIIIVLAYYVNSIAALIIHDYFAAFFALVWLIFYWWFSYHFVLTKKGEYVSE